MTFLERKLTLDLPSGQSAFLWGPRKTGKSTLLRRQYPDSVRFDYLRNETFLAHLHRPSILREELMALPPHRLINPIIIDEVQKVPAILDEIHALMEDHGYQFILCGSSARKVKRGQANLLGGRAWRFELFPLVSPEIEKFDLMRALMHGLIPDHYLQDNPVRSLRAYVQDYLKEEVFEEGLVRNMTAFSRFFEAMIYSHGHLTNYTKIAADAGVDGKTVKGYYQILVDTLLGYVIEPFRKKQKRDILTRSPKFYLFDVGVAGFIAKRHQIEIGSPGFGDAFEHFILMEIMAHRSYSEKFYSINFWMTKGGYEVDFVLDEGQVIVEVKSGTNVRNQQLKGIKAFIEEHHPKSAFVIYTGSLRRKIGDVLLLPYQEFLTGLWNDEII